MSDDAIYDRIGAGYGSARRPDPRIFERLSAALGDARSVVNIGAGVGSYEPEDRAVVAVEFSRRMIEQRPADAAPAVQARAEALPFEDGAFGAAMAVLTLHHWQDQERGLHEACRVGDGKVVLLTWMGPYRDFWLLDYVPEIANHDEHLFPDEEALTRMLGPVRTEPLAIPDDCRDGFMCAYWKRPACYLDANLRRSISTFACMEGYEAGLERLARDLATGAWLERYGAIQERREMDFGYRIVIAG